MAQLGSQSLYLDETFAPRSVCGSCGGAEPWGGLWEAAEWGTALGGFRGAEAAWR